MRVPVDAPLPVVVPIRRTWLRWVLPVGAVLALGCLWLLVDAGLRSPDPAVSDGRDVERTFGLLGFALFGGGVALLGRIALRRGPALELREDGLVSRASVLGVLRVPWDQVTAARVHDNGTDEHDLLLDLADAEGFIQSLSLPRRWLARIHVSSMSAPMVALGPMVDAPVQEVAARIEAELKRRRDALT